MIVDDKRLFKQHISSICRKAYSTIIFFAVFTLLPLENVQLVYYRCQLDTNHGYIQRLEYLKLESLELRRIYNDMVMVYNILRGHVNVSENNLSFNNPVINATISTRGHGFNLKQHTFVR